MNRITKEQMNKAIEALENAHDALMALPVHDHLHLLTAINESLAKLKTDRAWAFSEVDYKHPSCPNY